MKNLRKSRTLRAKTVEAKPRFSRISTVGEISYEGYMGMGSVSARLTAALLTLTLLVGGGCAGGRSGSNSGNALRFLVTFVTVDPTGAAQPGVVYRHVQTGETKTTDSAGVVDFELTSESPLVFEASALNGVQDKVDLGAASDYTPNSALEALIEVAEDSITVKAVNAKSDDREVSVEKKSSAPDPIEEPTPVVTPTPGGKETPKNKGKDPIPTLTPTPEPTLEPTPPETAPLTLSGSEPPNEVVFGGNVTQSKGGRFEFSLTGSGFDEKMVVIIHYLNSTRPDGRLGFTFLSENSIRIMVPPVEYANVEVCVQSDGRGRACIPVVFRVSGYEPPTASSDPAPAPGDLGADPTEDSTADTL